MNVRRPKVCYICGEPSITYGVYVPNEPACLLLGVPPNAFMVYGLCTTHLGPNFASDAERVLFGVIACKGAVMTPLDFFLAHRVPVFPITPGAKTPAVPKGTSWADWDDFTRPRPTGPYGVVLGALVVADTDLPATSEWANAHLPHTPFTVVSGPYHNGALGRGLHRYYRAPGGLPAHIRRDHLSLEFRRAGQYVVGPGSTHPSGAIDEAAPWSWRWDDIPFFPTGFIFDDGTVGITRTGLGCYAEPTDTVTQGDRTDELFRYVRHLKANDIDCDLAWQAVQVFNARRCDPPKSAAWLREWFGRAWRHRDQPNFKQIVIEDTSALDVVIDDTDDLDVIKVERLS